MIDRIRTRHVGCWLAAAVLGLGPTAWAQGAAAPEMSPEEAAMAAAMERAAKPGEQHAWLASLAGTWEFEGTFWMTPGADPVTATGTAVRTPLLGGRVIQEEVESEMFGETFHGIGHTGYDNVTGVYWSTWMDTGSTGLMTSTGSCSNGACTFEGTMVDPVTGAPVTSRVVSQHEADREHHEMFSPGPDGPETKTMEFVYRRKK